MKDTVVLFGWVLSVGSEVIQLGCAVEDVEQRPGQSQQITEAVEPEVDQFASQFHHLST